MAPLRAPLRIGHPLARRVRPRPGWERWGKVRSSISDNLRLCGIRSRQFWHACSDRDSVLVLKPIFAPATWLCFICYIKCFVKYRSFAYMQDAMAPEPAKKAGQALSGPGAWVGSARRGATVARRRKAAKTERFGGVTPSWEGAGFTGRRLRTWRF
uniref:Uncharacterized protein n=1 Tax=Pseudomonas aeruginosa TaxID=287 RepID=A0A2L1KF36_PSEAI|nr:Hypothetical protein [Pseudomonas aeruginosa]